MSLEETPAGAVDPLEELGFLARSRHRVALLGELDGTERTRRELHDRTGISQPTLGRILGDFEDREWVRNHHDGAYTLTPLGALLADELADLLDALATTADLAGVLEYLPVDEMDLSPIELARMDVVAPTSGDPLAHMRRFDALADRAASVRVFSNVLACAPSSDATDADRAFLAAIDELIVTADAVETGMADPDLRGWLEARIEADELRVHRLDGPAPFLYGLFDDVAGLVPIDEAGVPHALLETTDGPVHAWLETTFRADRRAASTLAAADLDVE